MSAIASKSFAQTVPTSVAAKTPEVSAFNRFIETPVSLYTGVPNISIPLYSIDIKGVNVPITLNYHAGGIRVDQDATWVGLGWSLDYGGEISRKTRGIPDEYYYLFGGTSSGTSVDYFMKLPNLGSSGWDMNAQIDRIEHINLAKRGGSDYMPDEFYYSALGYSGRFMFSQSQNKCIFYPKEDIHADWFQGPSDNSGTIERLYSWSLKMPNGISVDFGKNGYSKQEMTVMNIPSSVRYSWQIKSIRNSYNDSITYDYENFNYRLPKIQGQQFSLSSLDISGRTMVSNCLFNDSRVRKITFPGGRLEFSTIGRQDMPNEALDEINVYDNNNNPIRKIQFIYSYFYGDAYDILSMVDPVSASRIPSDYRYKRLKLDRISITATGLQPVNYSFEYYAEGQLPSKYSFSQDHWGFFNGFPNTSTYGFIPNLDPHFVGGDRRVKPDKSKAFSLKSILYPEGAKTEFIYEGNNADVSNTPSALLAAYQDDNFVEKSTGIGVSGYSRSSSYPSPTETINGVRYFRKQFTVAPGGSTAANNWTISTNFGISTLEQNTPYFADNVSFKLEKINSDFTRTIVKSFNTTDPSYPSSNASPRKGQDEGFVAIAPGDYEMTVALTYLNQPNSVADNQPYNLGFTIKWREPSARAAMVNVGGLRIKDINYYNSDDNLVRKKNYSYINPNIDPNTSNVTSGRIVSFPSYIQRKRKLVINTALGTTEDLRSLNYTSTSTIPLETTSGSYVGYQYVDENDVDIVNPLNTLKSRSVFSFTQPYFSQFYPQLDLGMYEPKEWARGKLISKKYYKGGDLIRNEDYEYYFVSPYANGTESLEDYVEEINTDFISYQSYSFQYPYSTSSIPEDFYDVSTDEQHCLYFYYAPFDNRVYYPCYFMSQVPYFRRYTGFDKIKSKTITSFDTSDKPLIQTELYSYEKAPQHYQLTKTTTVDSKGNRVYSEMKYPLDTILAGTEENARLRLVSNHQINTTLWQASTLNKSRQISQTDYRIDLASGLVLPNAIKTNTEDDKRLEIRSLFNKFDKKGNIQETQLQSGPKTCYLYSYNKQYLIAKIENANYSQVESLLGGEMAIESFSNLVRPNKNDIDTFLAPLKVLGPNISIVSYSYEPLVGMKSKTDEKGFTTYYDYDNLGRLKCVKDQNLHLIKSYEYHYRK